jgi:pre-mRNA-splicing factor ATP-dependent RNA helicase DHX15/PRP43
MLPITNVKEEILHSVKKFSTTILVGETGSGKSTQLPQYLLPLASGDGRCIACTQPRRVAAVSIAQRVAYEQNKVLGEEIGYSIRFEDKSNHKTKIKFVTDGVLLRECMSDSNLSRYDIVILDEAHERSLQTDILMGLLRQIQDKRPSLRLVVMSATLQIDLFQNFFKVIEFKYLLSLIITAFLFLLEF